MAIGTNGIATRENINSLKAGTYNSDLKRCVTYNSLIRAGFSVNNVDRYLSNPNRLVRYSDIIQQVVLTFKFRIDISSDSSMYMNGPITLDVHGSIILGYSATPSFENVREVEATEIEQDTSVSPILSSVANGTQVVGPFDRSIDETLGAPSPVGPTDPSFDPSLNPPPISEDRITLTKNNSNVNLLESDTYGPAEVYIVDGKKTVTYTLLTETYSVSDITPCTYKLSYSGSAYLNNANSGFTKGDLYASSTSTKQYEIITVNTNSSAEYIFTAYLKLPNIAPPTPTYNFRLRFKFDISPSPLEQLKVNFTCTIYSSSGAVLGNCSVLDETFTIDEMPMDIITHDDYYYIDLWAGDIAPQYVRISSCTFQHKRTPTSSWAVTRNTIENSIFTGSSPTLTGSGAAYTTLNPYNNYYSVDYLVYIAAEDMPDIPLV